MTFDLEHMHQKMKTRKRLITDAAHNVLARIVTSGVRAYFTHERIRFNMIFLSFGYLLLRGFAMWVDIMT